MGIFSVCTKISLKHDLNFIDAWVIAILKIKCISLNKFFTN